MDATSISASPVWKKLKKHQQEVSNLHIKDLFASNPERARQFSLEFGPLFIDFSKHPITGETMDLLLDLTAINLQNCMNALFSGKNINRSENRPALHYALRASEDHKLTVNNTHVFTQVKDEINRMENFVNALHAGEIRGFSGKPVDTLVNIGIGGSDLGPRLVVDALLGIASPSINVHFVANIDNREIDQVLASVDPEKTLFIVASKSFSSLETVTNAATVNDWLAKFGADDPCQQMVAVTANAAAAEAFGITPDRVFSIWDWVGGRYSVWSAIGLPVAASIGMDNFRKLLAGAEKMDWHFRQAPLKENIPVILALLDIWHINFFGAETLAVIPYDQSLNLLPDYLSQLFMESNGKHVNQAGKPVNYQTGAIIWGGTGTNCQHAFMQLLHQGTRYIPVEFLVACTSHGKDSQYQRLLYANCVAQGEALMRGNLDQTGIKADQKIEGNHPSTTILYESLTPETLGMILAMYEHRVFVQACIWDINPYDQWGVELGKKIARDINNELEGKTDNRDIDPSTRQLIKRFRNQ